MVDRFAQRIALVMANAEGLTFNQTVTQFITLAKRPAAQSVMAQEDEVLRSETSEKK